MPDIQLSEQECRFLLTFLDSASLQVQVNVSGMKEICSLLEGIKARVNDALKTQENPGR